MQEIAYTVRGFLTVRKGSLRVPLNGSLAVYADLDFGLFTGDLVLRQSSVNRTLLGTSLFSATVQIMAESPVIGRIDHEGRLSATATVDAVIDAAHAVGQTLISGGSCRTATHAVVPLRSKPGFQLERAAVWPASTTGRPSPGAGGSHRLSTWWPLAQGTPPSSISSRPDPRNRYRTLPESAKRRDGSCAAVVRFTGWWGAARTGPAAGCPATSQAH